MNLVNLIMTVCLANEPSSCHTEQLTFESGGDLKQCMFLAPPEIAKWTEQHPALNVVRWKCAIPGNEITL
jgi:hypothetical protein